MLLTDSSRMQQEYPSRNPQREMRCCAVRTATLSTPQTMAPLARTSLRCPNIHFTLGTLTGHPGLLSSIYQAYDKAQTNNYEIARSLRIPLLLEENCVTNFYL